MGGENVDRLISSLSLSLGLHKPQAHKVRPIAINPAKNLQHHINRINPVHILFIKLAEVNQIEADML